MKTIETILHYNLKEEEIEGLLIWGIINWCGAKKWISFDELLEKSLKLLPKKIKDLECFDKSKRQEYLVDLKRICYEHDIDFRFQKGFMKSNYKMAKKVYKLSHWLPFKYKVTFSMIIFIGLNKLWKAAYRAAAK